MEDTAGQSLPLEDRSIQNSSLPSTSRFDVSQIKNLQLDIIEDPKRSKINWKRIKFKEVSKDKGSTHQSKPPRIEFV